MNSAQRMALYHIIRKFLECHKDSYSEAEIEFVLKNYSWPLRNSLTVDILRQIYDELNILDEEKNIYMKFLKLIKQHFNIGCNIVEIGGGKIPSLGKKIALEQHNGTITVYDDKLITTNSPYANLILKKERIDKNKVLAADLLVAFMPCEGTKTVLDLAGRNHIDFIIALCEGSCNNELDFSSEWEQNIIYEARKMIRNNNLGTLEITYIEDNPYPIIYNKR